MSTNPPEDEYVERVRQADPAAGAAPDVAALHKAVDARTGPRGGAVGAGTRDELAVRRARWVSLPVRIAAVAAVALVVGGGGGYAIGAMRSETSTTADARMPGSFEGTGDAAAESAPRAMPDSGGAPVEGPQSALLGADWFTDGGVQGYDFGGRHTIYTASGLSHEPSTAEAWAMDGSAVFNADTAARVAASVGLKGEPHLADGRWTVESQDGNGAWLSLLADGAVSFSYSDPQKVPWRCEHPVDVDGDGDGGDAIASPCAPRDLGAPPSSDEAESAMRGLIDAAGLDPSAFEFDSHSWDDMSISVTAELKVGGHRCDMGWSGGWTGAGLSELSGFLAPPVDLGRYPVISPAAAVERLSDPRFGESGAVSADDDTSETLPEPDAPQAAAPEDDDALTPPWPTGAPPAATPGTSLAWPVVTVPITSAELVSAAYRQPGRGVVLMPAYELTDGHGGTWTVVAVADSKIDFSF